MKNFDDHTICAISTASGVGGIAVVRVSGSCAVEICTQVLRLKNKDLQFETLQSHQVYYADFYDEGLLVDDVLFSIFKAPKSYTGEDVVEISCHGSMFIQQKIVETLIHKGCRAAQPGEFTMRAFLNGKMDLAQAEAVADVIASQTEAAHQLAFRQMRGGISDKIKNLREELLNLAALLELELDFSEEDVEFADRTSLLKNLHDLKIEVTTLTNSFSFGNAIKRGIPVAIVGEPNVGKSTLLNALLQEEKAIVSEIPGTTRDVIEDTYNIDGVLFRFIDTAGLRSTQDQIEQMGIERTRKKMDEAQIILFVFDGSEKLTTEFENTLKELEQLVAGTDKKLILIANKSDKNTETSINKYADSHPLIFVSAKEKKNIHQIAEQLVGFVKAHTAQDEILLSNARHYEAFQRILKSIEQIENAFQTQLSSDLITIDIRAVLRELDGITGVSVVADDILGVIFGKFCIGK